MRGKWSRVRFSQAKTVVQGSVQGKGEQPGETLTLWGTKRRLTELAPRGGGEETEEESYRALQGHGKILDFALNAVGETLKCVKQEMT